jgi:hypothetical protein
MRCPEQQQRASMPGMLAHDECGLARGGGRITLQKGGDTYQRKIDGACQGVPPVLMTHALQSAARHRTIGEDLE